MRSSRFGPWNSLGSGGNWPTPVMRAPGGAVDGLVVRRAVEIHRADAAVGQDGEADEGLALLVERRTRLFGNQRKPGVVDLAEDPLEVGVEVDAHGVGEDVDAGVQALMGHRNAWRRSLRRRRDSARLPARRCGWRRRRSGWGCRSLAAWARAWEHRRWPAAADAGGSGCGGGVCLACCGGAAAARAGLRSGCGRGRRGSRDTGLLHRLKLLQRLLVERWPRGLLGVGCVRRAAFEMSFGMSR